jgi:hypothetical protein
VLGALLEAIQHPMLEVTLFLAASLQLVVVRAA